MSKLVASAKERVTARQASCASETAAGAAQLKAAQSAANEAGAVLSRSLAALAKARLLQEQLAEQLHVLNATTPKKLADCESTRQLKREQHELASGDAAIMAKMVKTMGCDQPGLALVSCGPVAAGLAQLSARGRAEAARQQLRQDPLDTRCVGAPTPTCGTVLDSVAQLHGSLQDRVEQIGQAQVAHEERCVGLQADAVAQTASLRSRQQAVVDALAIALRQVSTDEAAAGQRSAELQKITALVGGWARACEQEVGDLEFKVQQLATARVQGEGLVQDCEVTEWMEGPCSATCGGGLRKRTRQVLAKPGTHGHPCPLLEMWATCGGDTCPTDCAMSDWGLWGACSATCGGGTRSRERFVQQQPKDGGAACRPTADVQLCGVDACDVDCVLAEWGAWSPCSQRCAGGAQARLRAVAQDPLGRGTCSDAAERRDVASCPPTPCGPCPPGLPCSNLTAGFASCDGAGPRDLVFLIDASGSVLSEAFEAQKALLATALQYLPLGEGAFRVAVLGYASQAVVTLPLASEGATRALERVQRVKGGSDLAEALAAAGRLLAGRQSVRPATVLLLTDAPSATARHRVASAAASLRESGVRVTAAVANLAGFEEVTEPRFANEVVAGEFAALDGTAVARMLCPPRVP